MFFSSFDWNVVFDVPQLPPKLDCIKFSEEIGEVNCIVEL